MKANANIYSVDKLLCMAKHTHIIDIQRSAFTHKSPIINQTIYANSATTESDNEIYVYVQFHRKKTICLYLEKQKNIV